MKVSTILDQIDGGSIALPEFQRGYVWNRKQVRGLLESCYRRHPVGSLLVWATEAKAAAQRGDDAKSSGPVDLLLDGQQRMTSLYGVMRGKPPKFFDADTRAFTGLYFHLGEEKFEFYQSVTMKGDPLWIDVTKLMKSGIGGIGSFVPPLDANLTHEDREPFYGRLAQLASIADIDLHIEKITGQDNLDTVVDIFNRVNSSGTTLSKGDLALARICAKWPDAREVMNSKLKEWADAGYDFNLDWLLRSMNAILTGEARFNHLHNKGAHDLRDSLKRTSQHIDATLDLIANRLGLDHHRVLFGRYAIPVMVRYMDRKAGKPEAKELDKLLFWFAQAGMWGRFSGSTETAIDQDLAALEGANGSLDALIEQLRFSKGGLRIELGHFSGSSLGARFYPVLYMLTRMGEARDLGTGLSLKAGMLGKMSRLEMHHIFPKSPLYKFGYKRADVNALANFCFLTKKSNLEIRDRLPKDYFVDVEREHPGALASQWIPMDRSLWEIERYPDFLKARRKLLAEEANKRFLELLHGETQWLDGAASAPVPQAPPSVDGVAGEDEERELETLNEWVKRQGLPPGQLAFDYADPDTGAQKAVFDLAWENGLQHGLTQPVAVLLNEPADVLALASEAGWRCFTSAAGFRAYVETEILRPETA